MAIISRVRVCESKLIKALKVSSLNLARKALALRAKQLKALREERRALRLALVQGKLAVRVSGGS